ncbi:hypothetical protein [Massilia sp. YIM B04103]|uniref:hypothetical protein n=1 Tax=Massilia sp. YIM B04103 TaxID=2963106 RepID=UPI00210A28C3|nr:hypothetical protein [Massilia sp. YIM B04103]
MLFKLDNNYLLLERQVQCTMLSIFKKTIPVITGSLLNRGKAQGAGDGGWLFAPWLWQEPGKDGKGAGRRPHGMDDAPEAGRRGLAWRVRCTWPRHFFVCNKNHNVSQQFSNN